MPSRRPVRLYVLAVVLLVGMSPSCQQRTARSTPPFKVVSRARVHELPIAMELFESVFWEPGDTDSLRKLMHHHPQMVAGKDILEIGTGSGVLALCCLHHGAASVCATDVNPAAVACAQHNAERLGVELDARLAVVDQACRAGAFQCVDPGEQFDLIISNPPWENGQPQVWADYALYDPDFSLLRSLLSDARNYLRPDGKILLAYGCAEAIRCVHALADEYQYQVVSLDDRDLESLPPVFLPGMLVGLIPRP